MNYEELYNYCEIVADKFLELEEVDKRRINYNNLISSTKYALYLIDNENYEYLFDMYCLLRRQVGSMDIPGLSSIAGGYWIFNNLDPRLLNIEAYTFEKILKRERRIGDIYRGLNFLTMAKYNMYLNLDQLDLENITVEEIVKSLRNMEDTIDEYGR